MNRRTTIVTGFAAALIVGIASATPVDFTGNATADFSVTLSVEHLDPLGDVGLPTNPPAPPEGTISGWDLDRLIFNFDEYNDILQVGLVFFGLAGDADGDGDASNTAGWLAARGGEDVVDLRETESVCIAFDFDENGDFDLIAGVSASDGDHKVAAFSGNPMLPAFAFGSEMPSQTGPMFYSPTLATPDYELTISNVSQVETVFNKTVCFDCIMFSGSYQDDGIGEDNINPGVNVCVEDGTPASVQVQPSSMNLLDVYPNPFNPQTTLRVVMDQTGPAKLAVFNLRGQRVAMVHKGLLDVGTQEFAFDAGHLPSGMYLAVLNTEQGSMTERLILMK